MMLSATLGSSLPFVNELPATGGASGQFVAQVYNGGTSNVVEVDVLDDQQPSFVGFGSTTVYVGGNLTYGTHTVQARAVDYMSWMMGGAFGEWQTYSVSISSPMPSAPIDSNSAPNSVAEGAANGTQVGITAFSTIPNGGMVTYSLSNNAGGRFGIDANSGVVTVANSSLLNFESAAAHTITVQANAGSGSAMSQSFTIGVSNVNPTTPIDSNQTANSVPEGSNAHTPVGIIATSADPNGPDVTYTLSNDADGRFEINPNTGVVSVSAGALLDFESAASHTITVLADDGGGGSSAKNFTINLTNVNEAPEITSDDGGASASISVDEEQTAVTDVQSTDLDGSTEQSGDLVYTISGGADQGKFSIVANTGVLTFKTAPNFDIPADIGQDNVYDVQVTVTDPGGLTDVQDIVVTLTNVNEVPDFEPNPDVYQVILGRNQEAGKPIKDVNGRTVAHATDPDKDTLQYLISAGDTDVFKLDFYTGKLSLKIAGTELSEASYDLTVDVWDGSIFDSATIHIDVSDAVGVAGDTHAVENRPDNILVRFVRYSFDPSAGPLTATYTIQWHSAQSNDFESSPQFTEFSSGSVTFAAGETEKPFTLIADNDQVKEDIESFRVSIDLDPDGAANGSYIPVPSKGDVKDKEKQAIDSFPFLDFYVLDGVTLVAKQKFDKTARDDVNFNGTRDPADLLHGNPGFFYDDIYQGNVGDCWLMAGIAGLAYENWQQIESRFTESGEGYNVRLWNGSSWVSIYVSVDLERGFDMAQLSGDVDEDGYAEIWPILLEKAYASMVGGYEHIDDGGLSGDVYTALTGLTRVEPIIVGNTSELDLVIDINNARGQGHQVILGTKDVQPVGSKVYGNHAYLILDYLPRDSNNDGTLDKYEFLLYNPWGDQAPFWTSINNTTIKDYEILPHVNLSQ